MRTEIERIFGPGTQADIEVDKDDKLNTLVRVSVASGDGKRVAELAESLSTLPQTYRIERRSP